MCPILFQYAFGWTDWNKILGYLKNTGRSTENSWLLMKFWCEIPQISTVILLYFSCRLKNCFHMVKLLKVLLAAEMVVKIVLSDMKNISWSFRHMHYCVLTLEAYILCKFMRLKTFHSHRYLIPIVCSMPKYSYRLDESFFMPKLM